VFRRALQSQHQALGVEGDVTMPRHPLRTLIASAIVLTACGARPAPDKALPFVTSEVARFEEPWAMSFLPGSGVRLTGHALVTEKKGRLILVDTASGAKQIVAGAPSVAYGGQGGFGDVVAHPDFAGNGLVYLSWAEAGDGGAGAVVGRARLMRGDAPRLEGLTVIWRQSAKVSGSGHFGHRIAFGPDRKLYISSGERQKFTPSQDRGSNLGKIIRLNEDGSVPGDNPFAKEGGVAAQIWSYGHRNPLGLAFDGDGRLWEQEMGPAGGDELNLIRPGLNYGYPLASNGSHYDGRDIPDHRPGDGFEAPKLWWNPSISPSGLMIYSGNLFAAWRGDAFIGGLSSAALIRVDLNGERAVKAGHWNMRQRIREVEQGPDGAIWLLEDGNGGRLLKLTPK
jgi:aldose sugar dehydrogenase